MTMPSTIIINVKWQTTSHDYPFNPHPILGMARHFICRVTEILLSLQTLYQGFIHGFVIVLSFDDKFANKPGTMTSPPLIIWAQTVASALSFFGPSFPPAHWTAGIRSSLACAESFGHSGTCNFLGHHYRPMVHDDLLWDAKPPHNAFFYKPNQRLSCCFPHSCCPTTCSQASRM